MLLPATTPGLCTTLVERPRVGIRSIAVVTLSYRNLVSSGDIVTTATEMKSIAVHSMLKNTMGGFFEVCAGSAQNCARARAEPVLSTLTASAAATRRSAVTSALYAVPTRHALPQAGRPQGLVQGQR